MVVENALGMDTCKNSKIFLLAAFIRNLKKQKNISPQIKHQIIIEMKKRGLDS